MYFGWSTAYNQNVLKINNVQECILINVVGTDLIKWMPLLTATTLLHATFGHCHWQWKRHCHWQCHCCHLSVSLTVTNLLSLTLTLSPLVKSAHFALLATRETDPRSDLRDFFQPSVSLFFLCYYVTRKLLIVIYSLKVLFQESDKDNKKNLDDMGGDE